MTVTKLESGRWAVLDDAGSDISEHDSNAQAWRAADRAANELLNKSEDRSEWVTNQILRTGEP